MSTSNLIQVREMVRAAILAAQPSMVKTDFTIDSSWIPFSAITDPVTQAGRCWVIGSCVDDKDRRTRPDPTKQMKPLVQREIQIQVGYQQSAVLADDIAKMDTLYLLQEQIRDAVKNEYYDIPDLCPLWVRNETLRDENGLPIYYYMAREANVFEAYFTAFFVMQHQ